MSASSSSTEPPQPSEGRYSFQHFDQECDFGIENANGERVRKRKKPGRKPNPPTVQERRAQNRAAQKAFREREQQRREEKERQWRDYSEEIKNLKKQLACVQYEAKYLKACVLHLTLACLIHRGSVPHIWTESRIIPSNSHGEYRKPVFEPYGQHIINEAYQTPALLDMLLDNQCIVDFNKALDETSQLNVFESRKKKTDINNNTDVSSASYQSYISEEIITMNKNSQEPKKSFPRAKKQKLNPNRTLSSLESPAATSQTSFSSLPTKHAGRTGYSTSPTFSTLDENVKASPTSSTAHEEYNSHPLQSNQVLAVNCKPVLGVLFEPPALRTTEDIVNMPTLQALHILRLQLKLGSILGSMTPAALLPTALQRVVPHDIRIDYVPGAAIRDRMIIFQDYYNMDDCFQFLTQNTVFMGGDVRDTRNWVTDPEYSLKFWFLSHQLVDQSCSGYIDLATSDILHEELCKDDDSSSSEAEGMEATAVTVSATVGHTNRQIQQQTTHIPMASNSSNITDLKHHQNVYFREM
ncbi:hypothetical protein MAM1_0017c01597 [Mucor ambiguus]|uniref:BZIP domain-containing protein n=1 Tax=Mucor ambiguus TaxID=91626 RepID=A0A0C9M199_9FUNG|nr:hypothetical protein MAM1_0017c01597 [Mucor ambiguus]